MRRAAKVDAKLTDFDLSTRGGRYDARCAGFDVPKMKAGAKPADFDSRVQRSDGCWLWLGAINRDGYGRFNVGGRCIGAHRFAYEREHGKLPPGTVLRHSCDNPACCNPAHLAPGTHRDNQLDKFAKGRQAKGEDNGSSKLNDADVRSIRRKYAFRKCTYVQLAEEFGVSRDLVQKVVRRILWSHI